MIRDLSTLAVLVLSTLAIASCASTEGRWKRLQETEWVLSRIAGNAPLGTHPVTLEVGDAGRLSGVASVNRYSAGTGFDERGSFRVEAPMLTRMAGPPEAMDQEQLFVRLLVRADAWRMASGELQLLEGERELLAFVAR